MTLARLERLAAAHAADRDRTGAAAAQRRAEVMRLHTAGELGCAADRARAAAILADSDVAAEVEAAHAHALAAMASVPEARPLAATAYDRLRVLAGRPQKFGTQHARRDGARWPVDPATTDSERAKWGLPPLAELLARHEP